ncbi:hypothetical protein ACLOJK_033549 [Asimina triloba]
MVWFQCEDCGESLKKPKLRSHFRVCSAYKVSHTWLALIVEKHSTDKASKATHNVSQRRFVPENRCQIWLTVSSLTAASSAYLLFSDMKKMFLQEKYGPKGQGTASNAKPTKLTAEVKQNLGFDINVGLSSTAPWTCSLCNTKTTSRQTLLLHAEGKKHRTKARAFHFSQQKSSQTEQSTANGKDAINGRSDGCSTDDHEMGIKSVDELKVRDPSKATTEPNTEAGKGSPSMKKRKSNLFACGDTGNTDGSYNMNDGEVIQTENGEAGPERQLKRKKQTDSMEQNGTVSSSMVAAKIEETVGAVQSDPLPNSVDGPNALNHLICDWAISGAYPNKPVESMDPDGSMKIKKLQRLVLKAVQDAGITQDESQLREILLHKVLQLALSFFLLSSL